MQLSLAEPEQQHRGELPVREKKKVGVGVARENIVRMTPFC